MSNLGLELLLQEAVAEVGEAFVGEVRRDPQPSDDRRDPVRGVRLALRYHTEGRGDADRHVVSSVEIGVDDAGVINHRFELPVPAAGPISYDGRLIRVFWTLEARLDLKMKRDQQREYDLLVVPRNGFSVYTRSHPLT